MGLRILSVFQTTEIRLYAGLKFYLFGIIILELVGQLKLTALCLSKSNFSGTELSKELRSKDLFWLQNVVMIIHSSRCLSINVAKVIFVIESCYFLHSVP